MPCLGVFFYGDSVAITNSSVLLQECHKTLRDNQPVNWAPWFQACALAVLLAWGPAAAHATSLVQFLEEPRRATPTEKNSGLAAIR